MNATVGRFWASFLVRLLGSVAALSVVAALVFVLASHMLTAGMCGNRVVLEAPSPDGKWKAVIYERDCGATTDFSTQVSILKASDGVDNDSGNTFIADSNHGAVAVSNKGILDVHASWKSATEVTLSYPKGARIFKSQRVVAGVSIEYHAE